VLYLARQQLFLLKGELKMITGMHVRLAMGALELNNRSLGKIVQADSATVRRFLHGFSINYKTVAAMELYFKSHGVTFLDADGDGPGIRVKVSDEMKKAS
jgi:hypothetical protein